MKKPNFRKGGMILLALAMILAPSAVLPGSENENPGSVKSRFSLGAGIGVPYGFIGVNFEFNPYLPEGLGRRIHDYFSVSLGTGFSEAGSRYSIGLRLYPLGREKKIQPRISLYYGSTAIVRYSDDSSNLEGMCGGFGVFLKTSRRLAFDLEILFPFYIEGGWSVGDLKSKVNLAGGIRWFF